MVTVSEINRILKSIEKVPDLSKRIEAISEQFIDSPYVVNSLIGSVDVPEALVIRFDGFDCVTYMEIVLALALSETAKEFNENLLRIRYRNGEIAWQKRNHYTSDWWRNNEKSGLIENLT